jgi:hypothetical protein
MGTPLIKISLIEEEIWVSGNPSYRINLRTHESVTLERSFQFVEHKGIILGCSDEKGLEIIGIA